MQQIHSIAFDSSRLKDWIDFTSEIAALRWPTPTAIMNSDIVWQLHGSDPKNNVCLWLIQEKIVAYGWLQPPGHLMFDCHPDLINRSSILEEVLYWASERRKQFPRGGLANLNFTDMTEGANAISNPPSTVQECSITLSVLDSDSRLSGKLHSYGYVKTQHFEPMIVHDLSETSNPSTTVSIRPVEGNEFDAFLNAHREAWAPSTGLSMDKYLAVRSLTSHFDPELNLIALEDARIQACCIFWGDKTSQIGHRHCTNPADSMKSTGSAHTKKL